MGIQNSTSTQRAGDCWPRHWMPKAWALALHRRLSMTYLTRFTSSFADEQTVNEWAAVWAEGLAGITGEQLKIGLVYSAQHHEWPPTCAEFLTCCKSRPKVQYHRIEAPKAVDATKAQQHMARIRAMLANPRKPGLWWAEKIISRADAGERVSDMALRLASAALSERAVCSEEPLREH